MSDLKSVRVHCVNYLPLLSLRLFCSSSNLVLTCTVLLQVIVTCASWSISFWRLKFFSNEFQGLSDVFQQIINRWNERSRRFSGIGHHSSALAVWFIPLLIVSVRELLRLLSWPGPRGALSLGSLELKRSSKCILELNYLAEDIARRKLCKNACKSLILSAVPVAHTRIIFKNVVASLVFTSFSPVYFMCLPAC